MELEELKQSFLKHLVQSDELDDPLSLHVNYIQSLKTHQSHPTLQNFLLEALERTTQTFVEDPRYRNDPRYLRVWLDYAARCREPEDVFAFLAIKGICLDLAAYYEEYAGYMERRKIDNPGTYY
jgi:checkpoint serine/threonine-protein kinase